MISLDELVNKPDLIIKKLEKYSELVLIWNNVPYCVVSKVESTEDDVDAEELDLVAEEKPLPIASARFAEQTRNERTEERQEYASADAWFAGAPSYEEPKPVQEEEPPAPMEEETKVEEPEEIPFNPYLPLNRDKPRASSTPAKPVNPINPVPENEPTLDEVLASEDLQESYKFDYVPYQVLKKQHANLWDVMAQVLTEHPDHTMHAVDLARIINERGLYKTRDGKGVTPVQIRARVGHRPERFEALGGNMIRLIDT